MVGKVFNRGGKNKMETKKEPKFKSIKRAYNYACNNNCRVNLDNEKLIAIDGYYSYYYARDVLKCRFELGEKIITTDAYFSYCYARDVLKCRFELGEKIITTDAKHSYLYAKYILEDRFELGEKIITTDAYFSYCYARYVLKCRFELGEKIITTDAEYSYLYAKDILKNDFPSDFLELCSIEVLEYFLSNLEELNENTKSNIIKVLFKKKLLV
jgi:hypothetical protein